MASPHLGISLSIVYTQKITYRIYDANKNDINTNTLSKQNQLNTQTYKQSNKINKQIQLLLTLYMVQGH
jgi:hypothetical protein